MCLRTDATSNHFTNVHDNDDDDDCGGVDVENQYKNIAILFFVLFMPILSFLSVTLLRWWMCLWADASTIHFNTDHDDDYAAADDSECVNAVKKW